MEGGVGFRSFKAFNEALLVKQGWRVHSNPESILALCFKAKYYHRTNILHASESYNPSYTWKIIFNDSWVLKKGGLWKVGSGVHINIWEDNWLPCQNGFKVWSPKPTNYDISIMASELINADLFSWNMPDLVNNIFLPFEAAQIVQIPLSYHHNQD